MIIVQLRGGLGNQMFQYAVGLGLAEKNNTGLKLDLSWYDNIAAGDTPRIFSLDNYSITSGIATSEEAARLEPGFFDRLSEKLKNRLDTDRHYRFDPALFHLKGDYRLAGFYQSYKFFEFLRDRLSAEFRLKNRWSDDGESFRQKIAEGTRNVGLHIRRGDYAHDKKTNLYHGACSAEYYQAALSEMKKRIGNFKLFVFSDEIEWAGKNINWPGEIEYVSRTGLPDFEELLLMSYCRHQIIANSSFSWWAAWLNNNPEKIIISPKIWLQAADIDKKDLIPGNWLEI